MYVFYGFCKLKSCGVYLHLKSDVFCKITETHVMCLFIDVKIHFKKILSGSNFTQLYVYLHYRVELYVIYVTF